MKSWLVLPLASLVVIQADVAHAAPVPSEYTVQEGDTCGAVAARFYGDSRRVDLIHIANPTWGAPPHVLKPGDVIKLSPKPARALPPDPRPPEAIVVRPRGTVTVDGGHPAAAGETITRGAKVATDAASSVELVFPDESRIRMGERTQVTVSAPPKAVAGSLAGDSILLAGEQRTRMGDPSGRRPLTLATPSARVQMRGEVKVSVDAGGATRVAAYKGTSVLTVGKKNVDVREGFGVKVETGKAPGQPKPLPPAPMFGAPPPAVIFASPDGKAEISGSYGPGSGPGDMPATFRLQVSRDGDFGELVSDAVVPSSNTALSIAGTPGTYFVRVSAIDADGFEGAFSPAQRVIVGDIKVTPKGPRRASVEVTPNGAYCGVAGGPLAPTAGAFEIDTVRATSVRCAITADGAVTVREIAGAKVGPRVASATVTHTKENFDEGELKIVLTDAEKAPLDGVEVKPVPGDDASIGVFVSAGAPGTYKAPARWKHGAAQLGFAVHVGDENSPVITVTLDQPPKDKVEGDKKPTGPIAEEAKAALEIHADGGAGFVNNGLQQSGGRGRIGAGYSLRLGPGIISLGIDGGLEGYFREEFSAADASGNTAGRVAVGQLHAFSIGLPLQYRYGTYESRFRPYLGVTPEALFESASFSHLVGDHLASSVDQGSAKVLGLTGLIGGEVKVGPGAAFLEGGYRATTVASRDVASVNMRGIQTALGYRLIIGL